MLTIKTRGDRRNAFHKTRRAARLKKTLPALATLAIMMNSSVDAQEIEPRTFANVPVGSNFLRTGYSYSSGGVLADPSVLLEDAKAEVRGPYIAYIRALDVTGRSAQFKFLLPYSHISVSGNLAGEFADREVSGFSDPLLGFSIILYGAPALTRQAFSSYEQDLNVGVQFAIKPPLGQYDDEKLVNIGTNRWVFRTEVGLSKAMKPWILEASLAGSVFSDNKDFLSDGTRQQDPIYALQLHAIYNFAIGMWAAVSGTYYEGGDVTNKTKDGEVAHLGGPRNSRVAATFSFPIDKSDSIRVQGSTSIATRTGTEFDIYALVWEHRW